MFFKDSNKDNKQEDFIKITALLIHAAKIDESYSNQEEIIIKNALSKMGVKEQDIQKIIEKAKTIETNSNQILDFTKEIKSADQNFKIKIIESLWKIIYSDNSSDIYEANLMRRLSGLLYLDNKLVGDIKEKIKKNFNK